MASSCPFRIAPTWAMNTYFPGIRHLSGLTSVTLRFSRQAQRLKACLFPGEWDPQPRRRTESPGLDPVLDSGFQDRMPTDNGDVCLASPTPRSKTPAAPLLHSSTPAQQLRAPALLPQATWACLTGSGLWVPACLVCPTSQWDVKGITAS